MIRTALPNPRLAQALRIGALALLAAGASSASVVVNEIMYHPPSDRDELQFIELHNAGSSAVNLQGWKFTKGVQCELPNLELAPGGFAVVSANPNAFRRHYGTNVAVAASFSGRLKHSGERLQLERPDGSVADTLRFSDRPPWPLGPDGYGASLERRVPLGPSDDPGNWGGSSLPRTRRASGSPGETNSNHSVRAVPWVDNVELGKVLPGAPVSVNAHVRSAAPVDDVRVLWRSVTDQGDIPEQSAPMKRSGGSATNGQWQATIPAQPAGRLLRVRVVATDAQGGVRFRPDPQDPRPTLSAMVMANTNAALIPQVRLLSLGGREGPGASFRRSGSASRAVPARGPSAFVVLPTNGGPVLTFDYIRLTPRQDGWKVRLHKDQPYEEMTTLNLVNGGRPRWLLSEYLGYELFRRAGGPTPLAGHLRAWFDDRPLGYCLYVEQPNSSFLRRVKLDPDGNLYKILWYTQGLEAQHEKKNNPHTGHDDLRAVVEGLETRRNDQAWSFIEQNFNVDNCVNYFAVGQCIQNWDGCFNNYFTYRAPGNQGRWEMIPWDLDKTWGDFDGASSRYDWYGLPLTFGMTGDREPGARWFARRNSPWGSAGWWRPPGWFSGPLLANPTFRQRYLARIGELCRSEFSEERFGPVIAALQTRLTPEVRFRAQAEGLNEEEALSEFRENLESFRRQLKERRAFLLRELKSVQ